ncbi:extracellular mutant protein 11 domain-containing protein [Sarocladium implicatum]|nr:extracellular mutant protein 11 domain-containing protein [Sarocladium implicatum]
MAPRGSLRDLGNKLHNFAVCDGEDEYQTALMRLEDAEGQVDDVPANEVAKNTREEVAAQAHIAMPKPQHIARPLRERSLAGQAHARSPVRSRHASPRPASYQAESTDHYNGLFTGSVLNDDFMRSEASTPHPDIYGNDENTVPGRRRDFASQKPPTRTSVSRQGLHEEPAKFVAADDGFMHVVQNVKKYTPTALRDGFAKEDHRPRQEPHQHRSDRAHHFASNEHQTGLPIRTEPRRLTKAKEERILYSARPASPAYEPRNWTSKRPTEFRGSPQREVEPAQQPPSELSDDGLHAPPTARKLATDTYGGSVHADEPTHFTTRDESRARKRQRENPDYDDQALSNMSYKNLRDESFDFDPSKAALAGVTQDGTMDLPSKLEQRRHRGEEEQRQFFAGMPMQEWEESGDWFVDQFASLMKKMRDARREKRKAIQEFEDEAERREEVVRTRSNAIDRKLGKMRQDGMKVVSDGN